MKRSAVCLLSLSILLSAQCAQAAAPGQPSPQELFKQGKYAEAQRAYEEVISAKRNAEVKEQRAYAELLLGYGRTLSEQRKYDEALKMIEQAKAIADAFALPGDFQSLLKAEVERITPLNTQRATAPVIIYGVHSRANEEHDAAEQEFLYKASIEFAKERYGALSMGYLLRHIEYAKFLTQQHRPDDLVKEAAICREVFSKLPPDYQAQTAPQILQFAESLASGGLPIEADTVGSIVMQSVTTGKVKNSTQIADSLERLAHSFESAQASDSAQKYYAASVQAYEKQVAPDDPRLAKMRDSLADFYKKHNKNGAAIELLEMSVAAQSKNIAMGTPEALKSLSELCELYCTTGNLDKAKSSANQLAMALQHAASDADVSPAPLLTAAGLLASKHDTISAMDMYTTALKCIGPGLGSNGHYIRANRDLQKEVRELAIKLAAQGESEAAEKVFDLYIASRSTASGQPTQQTLNATIDKANFYIEQEMWEKAAVAALSAVELNKRFQGSQDYRFNTMAQQFVQHKQYDAALQLTQAWLDSAESSRNPQLYQIVEAKTRIAMIYREQGKIDESTRMLQDLTKDALARLDSSVPQVAEQLRQTINKLNTPDKDKTKDKDNAAVLQEVFTSIAQSANYGKPVDGLIRLQYTFVAHQMYPESISFMEALVDANAKEHGASSLQASNMMRELARVYQLHGDEAKRAEMQKGADAILTMQRRQQAHDPNATDIWNPRAPIADTIKAAAALGTTGTAPEAVIQHPGFVHLRNVAR